MKIKRFMCGPILEDGYIIYHQDGGGCYIIDPGYQPKGYLDYLRDHSLTCRGILLTHHHDDHTGAVDTLADALECPVFMHELDTYRYRGRVDHALSDGDIIDLDGEDIKVLLTPGHTRGSVCFYSEKSKVCFTGDTIFDTDLGRTDLSDGSEKEMIASIRNVVSRWGNDIHIYPGHEGDATMKQVRKYNTEYLAIMEGQD